MSTPPILIIKRGSASASDIRLARAAGIVVLVVKDAADVRYMDPPLAPIGRLPAVAIEIIKTIQKEGKLWSRDDVNRHLAAALMQDAQPAPAAAIVAAKGEA